MNGGFSSKNRKHGSPANSERFAIYSNTQGAAIKPCHADEQRAN